MPISLKLSMPLFVHHHISLCGWYAVEAVFRWRIIANGKTFHLHRCLRQNKNYLLRDTEQHLPAMNVISCRLLVLFQIGQHPSMRP